MKRLLIGFLVIAVVVGTSPESLIRLDPELSAADAKRGGRGGGYRGGGGRGGASRGARARPARQPAAQRPSTRPAATRPAKRPAATRPAKRPNGNRPNRPDRPGINPPNGNRPNRPDRPIAGHPGGRPPNWRPPGHRPPNWRPPYYRPPYYRPPHNHWGDYYWGPTWGWYFTGAVAGATLVYIVTLPEDKTCEEVKSGDETLFVCDGVLYRATYYQDELVYEIVSDDDDAGAAPAAAGDDAAGGGALRLTSPLMKGDAVRDLQNALIAKGLDVGGADGVFGGGTDKALRQFQDSIGLPVTGELDPATAAALDL